MSSASAHTALKKQLTWHRMEGIREARAELVWAQAIADQARANADAAQQRVDALVRELELEQEEVKVKVAECTSMPHRGALVYHCGCSAPMQRVLIDISTYGRAIRFRADAAGPVIAVTRDGIGVCHEDMMLNGDGRGHVPAPLYQAGALLEWRTRWQNDDIGHRVAIDHSDFGADGASLRLVKEAGDPVIPRSAVYDESALDYTIIDSSGFPRKIEEVNLHLVRHDTVALEPITGQVVSEELMCSAISHLPEDAETQIQEILCSERYAIAGTVYLTKREIAIPIEPQVKSAVRRQ